MTATGHGGPGPDLYQLLGVPQEASREEIGQAWRRRARAEHPDSRPRDTTAPGRFRVLAEAYQILSDPVRRAAYDQALEAGSPGPGAVVPVVQVRRSHPAGPGVRAPTQTPGPPLRAGPVRVESPDRAVLAWWYLARKGARPW